MVSLVWSVFQFCSSTPKLVSAEQLECLLSQTAPVLTHPVVPDEETGNLTLALRVNRDQARLHAE